MRDTLIARSPRECSKDEVDRFVRLAAEGGEVAERNIRVGANRAALLVWVSGEAGIVATAAIKKPFRHYRDRIFRKAGVPDERHDYGLELGYIYVDTNQRRRGHCRRLVQRAITFATGRGIYAMTRTDNESMQRILGEAGFARMGSDYLSERVSAKLLLFIRAPSQRDVLEPY